MIAHLRGNVINFSENCIILDVNGVGYEVICSKRVIDSANSEENNLSIFTELIVRDSSWTLYGFLSEQEKTMFDALVSVQGVGGRIAVALLSAFTDEELYNALISENQLILCRANGVGERLAARIISELKHKITKICLTPEITSHNSNKSTLFNDVKSALSNLGYNSTEIDKALLDKISDDIHNFDDLFKLALKKLSGANK